VVIGATGGIGAAVCRQLQADPGVGEVLALSRASDVRLDLDQRSEHRSRRRTAPRNCPTCGWSSWQPACCTMGTTFSRKRRCGSSPDAGAQFAVNAMGPALVLKHFQPLLPRNGKAVFAAISARVGSISDNRIGGWYSYRASKAALNMMLKCAAIEIGRTRKHQIMLGLHPGTVDTGLSKPFQSNVPDGKLFSAEQSAGYMLDAIEGASPDQSGSVIDWDGKTVPA
jgi:NAD(P)-dependent dehydrogenase (short-subunit alcohol dehydrogenase family)